MIREAHPLKQGLKLIPLLAAIFLPSYSRGTSTKTRIETKDHRLNFVGSRKIIGDILENTFGFKRSGRHWIEEQIGIFIEVPGDYLAGSKDKITTMTVEGLKLYIIGIEDLIIDRMAACQEWKSETDCRQAHYLLRYYKSRIDFKNISEKAKQDGLFVLLKKLSRT